MQASIPLQNVFIVKYFDEEVLHDMLWDEKQNMRMKWKFIGDFFYLKKKEFNEEVA